jgi:hypothetical protein
VISRIYVDGSLPRASLYGLKFLRRTPRFLDVIRLKNWDALNGRYSRWTGWNRLGSDSFAKRA